VRFEESINKATWQKHEEILRWADELAEKAPLDLAEDWSSSTSDEIVLKGLRLRKDCLTKFKDKLKGVSSLRVLVHVPSAKDSPGGASVFNNLVHALNYIGVEAVVLPWQHYDIGKILNSVRPNVLLTSDHEAYLSRLDWSAVAQYRVDNILKLGLTASLEEYGNTSLTSRLRWSRKNGVNFFYSFRTPEYLLSRKEYQPFFGDGYEIHSVEFGANILAYFPVAGISRDIDYVFLASSNPDKWPRYFEYLTNVLSRHPGFLDGPGWTKNKRWAEQASHRYLYARAKVGLNLHIQDSIDWPSELNERTYILAACGVPQLIDHPKLLSERFRLTGMFVADGAKEYEELFEYVLNNSHEAKKRALIAMEDAYAKHTTFHRAEQFAKALLCEVVK
jgi:hypothetical protein